MNHSERPSLQNRLTQTQTSRYLNTPDQRKFLMKISTKTKSFRADLLALGVSQGQLSPLAHEWDRKLKGLLSQIIKKENWKGKTGDTRLVTTDGSNILLLGLGNLEDKQVPLEPHQLLELLRKSAARAVKAGNRLQAKTVAIEDFEMGPLRRKIPVESRGQALAEGAILAGYSFDAYKKPGSPKTVSEVALIADDGARLLRGAERGRIFAEATNAARDLINTPANDFAPRHMVMEAKKLSKLPGLTVKVLSKAEIEKLGMGCYLAVSVGSVEPPAFIHITYRPKGRPKKRIALIGKGVTFDSGGLSIKTAQSMETMKDDMSGSAAMLCVMRALPVLKPNLEVHGFAAMTENMPSGSAVKPGDIVRSMNGKTVEILNTDAEGRLTLADAVCYAQKQKPDLMIDFATLTGACVIALGELCSGILGNNQALVDNLIAAGKSAGEKIWQLPLIEEYREELKSSFADLKNIGGRWGGTINGALFIQEFVDPKIPWAHIDIAGPSWTEREQDYGPRGGTGHIVRTLLEFLMKS
jgi:leucyl aminopeptidase